MLEHPMAKYSSLQYASLDNSPQAQSRAPSSIRLATILLLVDNLTKDHVFAIADNRKRILETLYSFLLDNGIAKRRLHTVIVYKQDQV